MRLPVEFAMFSAVVGLAMTVFGAGMALYLRFVQGAAAVQPWTMEFAAWGLGIFVLTDAVYFLKIIQFVRQSGVRYDKFFMNLPLESADHPEDAGDKIDDLIAFLQARWHVPLLVIAVLPLFLRRAARGGLLHPLFDIDLGPVHAGGTHWSVGDVAVLGGGSLFVIFFAALLIRRVLAMQKPDPKDPR